jgi:hypothetical protein
MAAAPALRTLRDCGCVRARVDRLDFVSLVDIGLATARPVARDPDLTDYRLTEIGWRVSERLAPCASS